MRSRDSRYQPSSTHLSVPQAKLPSQVPLLPHKMPWMDSPTAHLSHRPW